MTSFRFSVWPVIGLLLLSSMPLTFGALRLLQFLGVVDVMPKISLQLGLVVPLVLHIAGAALYAILGAFQFSASIRRRWPSWHRVSGRIALCSGAIVAVSALWLTFDYATASIGGIVLVCFRAAFASGLLMSIMLGFAAIRRRDFARHREWMIRAYALALGAGTQMIVLMFAEVIIGGPPGEIGRSLLMGLAWGINLVIAEWAVMQLAPSGHRKTAFAQSSVSPTA